MDCPMRSVVAIVLASVLVQAAEPAQGQEPAPVVVGGVTAYPVRAGDTLGGIGARFGVDTAALARDNGLAARAKLAVGYVLRIDNRHIVPAALDPGTVVVNVPQRMLFYGVDGEGGEGYPVAVGRPDWQTPIGEFVVMVKEEQPTWDVPASILEESRRRGRLQPARVPPGPDNPLGAFWVGLSLPGIGLHGTNASSSIFRAVTHGCIRLHPDDIARLFAGIQVGARGRIIYEPVLVTGQGSAVYLEVHRDVYQRRAGGARGAARALALAAGLSERIDWDAADAVATAGHGVARDVTLRVP